MRRSFAVRRPQNKRACYYGPVSDLLSELTAGLEAGASDWQFCAGQPVAFRVGGRMVAPDQPPLTEERVRAIAAALGGAPVSAKASEGRPGPPAPNTFSALPDTCVRYRRELFRFHAYTAGGAFCFTLRRLAAQVPDLDGLGVPAEFARQALAAQRGLILVTGPTGSGKSTTLAAAVDRLNRERTAVILTLEDPIEYRHPSRRAVVRQLEKGTDFISFSEALRGALRADPDILLVGEMRDAETIAAALSAAETGHLVLTTLHAASAPEAVARITGSFPPAHAAEVRAQCAQSLVAVLAQQLVRTPAGTAVAAFELLIGTPAVKHLIQDADRRFSMLANEISTGRQTGMIAMDQSLEDLWRRGVIARSEALRAAFNPGALEPRLRRAA
jgi:twitching motility protein PilT